MNGPNGTKALLPGCAVILGLVVAASAGCGRSAATGATASGATAGATTSATPSGGTGSAGAPACSSGALTVTLADNDKSLCVTVGTKIAALLRGTVSDRWSAIRTDSGVLVPRADPRMTLMAGVTGAAFEAAHPGVAVVSSVRYPCRQTATTGAATASPAMGCGAANAFRVTLVIQAS